MSSFEHVGKVLKRNAIKDLSKFDSREKILHNLLKVREDRIASVKIRRNILESQKRKNYIHEYERLKGIMSSGTVKQPSSKYIEDRITHLKELAKHSVEGKPHEIYQEDDSETDDDQPKAKTPNKRLNTKTADRSASVPVINRASSSIDPESEIPSGGARRGRKPGSKNKPK